jgi:hypothetical protein
VERRHSVTSILTRSNSTKRKPRFFIILWPNYYTCPRELDPTFNSPSLFSPNYFFLCGGSRTKCVTSIDPMLETKCIALRHQGKEALQPRKGHTQKRATESKHHGIKKEREAPFRSKRRICRANDSTNVKNGPEAGQMHGRCCCCCCCCCEL